MRYELKRNTKGMITQCETNADGGNIYARREEINKQALQNLARPTPGKLGDLSNMQIFNFTINTISTNTSGNLVLEQYNTTETTGNVTDCIMFNSNSINGKASYYNIIDIKVNAFLFTGSQSNLLNDSFIEFYALENIEGSTTSLGRKIPRRAPLNGTSSGQITWTTDDPKTEYQYLTAQLTDDSVNIPSRLQGIRCSGLALKTIFCNYASNENLTGLELNCQVYVDVSSVSNSY